TRTPREVIARFWLEKARRPGVAGPLEARSVGCALLVEAVNVLWSKFELVRLAASHPLFFCVDTGRRMNPSWVGRIVASIAPGVTAHSLRVGLATEAHAAGCSLDTIRALGRWKSNAALIYIIGALDEQFEASRRVGSAGLERSEGELRRSLT